MNTNTPNTNPIAADLTIEQCEQLLRGIIADIPHWALEALREHGPLRSSQLARTLGIPHRLLMRMALDGRLTAAGIVYRDKAFHVADESAD